MRFGTNDDLHLQELVSPLGRSTERTVGPGADCEAWPPLFTHADRKFAIGTESPGTDQT